VCWPRLRRLQTPVSSRHVRTLTALDAKFLELEQLDEGALMSIGGVTVFDPCPNGGILTVEDVRANLAHPATTAEMRF
jgi:hypothetical protein